MAEPWVYLKVVPTRFPQQIRCGLCRKRAAKGDPRFGAPSTPSTWKNEVFIAETEKSLEEQIRVLEVGRRKSN